MIKRPGQLGELKPVWLKAAVAGSLWATIEIIAGSFLHNLRIPFSGSILTFVSVYFMIAFSVIWKEKGMILRAGLICALMKSISPSAIILGPMLGILSEALLLEAAIFLFGQNLPAYMLGGALALFSAILHKAGSLLLLYGFNLLSLLSSMYDYASRQLRFEGLSGSYLLLLISIIYLLAGAFAAYTGYRAGKKAIRAKVETEPGEINLEKGRKLFEIPARQKYSPFLLGLHLISIIAILYLLSSPWIYPALLLAGIYVTFSILRYHASMHYFRKPMFWISFALLTFLAGIFWNGFSSGSLFDKEGLWIGFRMNIRAVVILLGFSSISIELRNPVIRTLLMNRGFSGLYTASGLAFSALPFSLGLLPKGKELIFHPFKSFNNFFLYTDKLLKKFETENYANRPVIILSGERGQGKTSFLFRLAELLREKGLAIYGFAAQAVHEQDRRTGFDLKDLHTGHQFPLCREAHREGVPKMGKYYFDPEAIQMGKAILSNTGPEAEKLVVIDEVGPLELEGGAWSGCMRDLMDDPSITQLWVVRKGLVSEVRSHWNLNWVILIDIAESSPENAASDLLKVLSAQQG